MSADAMLTANQLARRREGAIRQLLYHYQEEYTELLKLLGRRCHAWSKQPPASEITAAQKSALATKYDAYLKGRLETQRVEAEEILELKRLGVPVVTEKRLKNPKSLLTFAEAERYLAAELAQTPSAARLEPHLLTSSPRQGQEEHSDAPAVEERSEESAKTEAEKIAELERLEAFACSACYREMDREDDFICLIGRQGKYTIRRNAFTIGCTAPLVPAVDPDAPPAPPSQIGRKRKATGDLPREQESKDVDVDLAREGKQSTENCVYAHAWLKHNGRLCIKPMGFRDILIDGNELRPGDVAFLKHWSLLEIEGITLMVLVNQSAMHRMRKRSRHEINI